MQVGRRIGSVGGAAAGILGRVVVASALVLTGGAAAAAAADTARNGMVPKTALERRVGYAFRLADGAPVYREIHEPRVVEGRLMGDRVTYRAPDGDVIARKRVDFTASIRAPSFRLEDLRSGYIEGLERVDGRIVLFHRDDADAPAERVALESAPESVPGLVADAGYNRLIYRRMDDLVAGATLTFPFAVPSRLETIEFEITLVDRRRILGEPALVLHMVPASMLLSWLVDPIEVAYHADTHALLRYEGVSNLPRPDGDGNYRVRIDFHPSAAERFAGAGD